MDGVTERGSEMLTANDQDTPTAEEVLTAALAEPERPDARGECAAETAVSPQRLPPSLPVRYWMALGSALEWLFGLGSLLVGLALLASIPVLQFASLGYLLESSGRVVRTGRLREGFIGVRPAARLGSLALGSWLLLWPLRFLADLWYSAQLLDPTGSPALTLRLVVLAAAGVFVVNLMCAWLAGGKLRHFFWPLLAPPLFAMWTLRRVVASHSLRPLVRPVVGTLSPRLLADLTNVPPLRAWFPPAAFWCAWRERSLLARARQELWTFYEGLRCRYYFSLGVRGFCGAVVWLLVPAVLMTGVTRVPLAVYGLSTQDGPVRLFTFVAAVVGLGGAVLMAVVLLYLPFLQAHFAAENRWRAMFELGRIRRSFRHAPVAYAAALVITILFALPLFLLRIEYTIRELLWLPSLVFVLLIWPARLLTGWALARACRREVLAGQPRHGLFRLLARLVEIPVVLLYVLVLFLMQYVTWTGAWGLLEQPPFLLPVPFFLGV